jgi:hypothetical protein
MLLGRETSENETGKFNVWQATKYIFIGKSEDMRKPTGWRYEKTSSSFSAGRSFPVD